MSDSIADAAPASAAAAVSPTGADPTQLRARARRREFTFLAGSLLVAGGVLAYLVTVADARLDAPTFALAAGAIALLYALRQMFFVVQALSRPPVEHLLDRVEQKPAGQETRRERFRVLRAIKQLDEDYALGKLEDADHRALREGLVLQAVELNRRIAGERAGVHPHLLHLLEEVPQDSSDPDSAASPDAAASDLPTREVAVCGACKLDNDADARFCKHCGATIETETGEAGEAGEAGETGEAAAETKTEAQTEAEAPQ